MGPSAGGLVEPGTLLLHVALVAVALQHGLAHCSAARPATPRTVLEARLGRVTWLHCCRRRLCIYKQTHIKTKRKSRQWSFHASDHYLLCI